MNELKLVGYLTGDYWEGYPIFLSIEKLEDYDIDVSNMLPIYAKV